MAKQKWFWITLFVWCLMGAAGAWALIYSPLHYGSRELCRFAVGFNGAVQDNHIMVHDAPIRPFAKAITRQWERDGWRCASGNLDLAPILLNAPEKVEHLLPDLAQAKVFERGDSIRALLLLKGTDERTYQWVAEVPKSSLASGMAAATDFPVKPPPGSSNILLLKAKTMETCQWSQSAHADRTDTFGRFYAAQGFSGRLWSKRGSESIFLLQRGSVRLLAVLGERDGVTTVALTRIKKEIR